MLEEIQKKLNDLKEEKKDLDQIANVSFKSKKEGEKYIKKHFKELSRLNEIEAQIQTLEWELMTPEGQKKYLEEEEISKLKREGKL